MSQESLTLYTPKDLSLNPEEMVTLVSGSVSAPLGKAIQASTTRLRAGSFLGPGRADPCLQAVGSMWIPGDRGMERACLLRALQEVEIPAGSITYSVSRTGYTLASVTLSDSAYQGHRGDESGALIRDLVRSELPLDLALTYTLPDEPGPLKALLHYLAFELGVDLILTTGGTGLTTRDITPEATLAVLEKDLPGVEQAMMASSLAKTPHAVLSRGRSGITGRSLIINLPGSPAAVRDNLGAVLPALKHALEKIDDDPSDCAVQ